MKWPLKYFEYLVTHLRCPQFLLVKPKPNLFVGVDINAVVQKNDQIFFYAANITVKYYDKDWIFGVTVFVPFHL